MEKKDIKMKICNRSESFYPYCLTPGPTFLRASVYCQVMNGLGESGGSPNGFQPVLRLHFQKEIASERHQETCGDHLGT